MGPVFSATPPPGTVLLPLTDPAATWNLLLVWQRGGSAVVLKAMVNLLTETARRNQRQ